MSKDVNKVIESYHMHGNWEYDFGCKDSSQDKRITAILLPATDCCHHTGNKPAKRTNL